MAIAIQRNAKAVVDGLTIVETPVIALDTSRRIRMPMRLVASDQ